MIDRETVDRIKEAANIVDVVSEFVTLRRSGSNLKGLCPFHDEKTPSFIVSPARGTCHCFGCGKGGNAITFIMEHEQMTYPEALRWLAAKYHIEIRERELSSQEQEEQSQRESMLIVNEWAAKRYQTALRADAEGVTVGMQYFRMRGIRDDIIAKFRLGYAPSDRLATGREARQRGYNTDFLLRTGVCYQNDRGELIDRYAGRVIFPWTGLNGKVVAFGGRLLDQRTKGVAQKYVNSPDSDIFHKERELYGIAEAKRAIAKEDGVYMVEGYTDVIAMHQAGIENVVANSGTALSIHQIRTLHRFTQNITLLYDGDAAGIHAALRGTDMLLQEGMNLRVLLLPDGDDPDSFARKHTAAELRDYIEANKTDFIRFKTRLLLQGQTDPVRRSEAIDSILRSIAFVQNPILRDTYLHDSAAATGLAEATLIGRMNAFIRDQRAGTGSAEATGGAGVSPAPSTIVGGMSALPATQAGMPAPPVAPTASPVERLLMQMLVRHGSHVIFRDVEDDAGEKHDLTVAAYIAYNLAGSNLTFADPLHRQMLDEVAAHGASPDFHSDEYLLHHDDIRIAQAAASFAQDKYALTQSAQPQASPYATPDPEAETEKLRNRTTHLILDFQMDYVERHMRELQAQIAAAAADPEKLRPLMEEYKKMQTLRNAMAKKLGCNVVSR